MYMKVLQYWPHWWYKVYFNKVLMCNYNTFILVLISLSPTINVINLTIPSFVPWFIGMLFGKHGSMNVNRWTWASEQDRIFFEIFYWPQKNIGRYFLTHGKEYIMMWRNILPHVHGWTKLWMKHNNGWTQPICNQKLCANVNSTSSQPKGLCQLKHYMFISKRYVPIGNYNMRPHILNTISPYFLFEFSLSNLLCLRSFLPLEEKNCIFPPFHPNWLAPSFLWLPPICNCYTYILQWQKEN
jgi:hypothetical protein